MGHFPRNVLRSFRIELEKSEFVDPGAGKGRSLLVAAEFPLRRVWGSELSPMLSETARRNCKAFRSKKQVCKNFEVVCGDAAEFSLPDAPLVIYPFNPFSGLILSRVLSNLERSGRSTRLTYSWFITTPYIARSLRALLFDLFRSGTDKWDYRKLCYKFFRARLASSNA